MKHYRNELPRYILGAFLVFLIAPVLLFGAFLVLAYSLALSGIILHAVARLFATLALVLSSALPFPLL